MATGSLNVASHRLITLYTALLVLSLSVLLVNLVFYHTVWAYLCYVKTTDSILFE